MTWFRHVWRHTRFAMWRRRTLSTCETTITATIVTALTTLTIYAGAVSLFRSGSAFGLTTIAEHEIERAVRVLAADGLTPMNTAKIDLHGWGDPSIAVLATPTRIGAAGTLTNTFHGTLVIFDAYRADPLTALFTRDIMYRQTATVDFDGASLGPEWIAVNDGMRSHLIVSLYHPDFSGGSGSTAFYGVLSHNLQDGYSLSPMILPDPDYTVRITVTAGEAADHELYYGYHTSWSLVTMRGSCLRILESGGPGAVLSWQRQLRDGWYWFHPPTHGHPAQLVSVTEDHCLWTLPGS